MTYNYPNMNDTITINSPSTGGYTITSTDTMSTGLYWATNTSQNQVLTSNGSSTGWANISLADPDLQGSTLSVKGNADFEGEVTIKGKLAILHPNPKLEDKWDELKELGKRYKELEAEIIEKEKMWAILKK
jgi:hypothetical protein